MNLEHQILELTGILGEPRIRSTFRKLAEIEAGRCLKKIEQIKRELMPFEKHLQMSSEDAWNLFISGKLGDDMDIMEWMGLCENLSDFQDYYNRIQKSNILC